MWARRPAATLTNDALAPGTSWNIGSLGATPHAGDRVIVTIGITATNGVGQPTVTGLTDGGGHTWWKDLSLQPSIGTFVEECSVWSTVANGSAITNLTASFDKSLDGGVGAVAVTYSGISTVTGAGAAVDISKITAGGVDSGTTAATTSAADELKIGVQFDAGSSTTLVAGTSDFPYAMFRKRDNNGNAQVAVEDADSGPSGSTVRATFSGDPAQAQMVTAVLVYKLSTDSRHSILFTDLMRRANAANLGASWSSGYTSQDPIQIAGNLAEPTTAGTSGYETVNSVSIGPNQWARCRVMAFANTPTSPQVILRASAPTTVQDYCFQVGPSNGVGSRIGIHNPGFSSLLDETTTAWEIGDFLLGEVEGSLIKLYRNTDLLLTITDATLTSGRVGLDLFASGLGVVSNCQIDTFQAGELIGPATLQQVGLFDPDLRSVAWFDPGVAS